MKKYFLLIISFLVLLSCSNNDDSNVEGEIPDSDNPVSEEETAEEVEVYNADLVHDNLTLIMENGGTTASLITKKGNPLHEWEFDLSLGNDLELLDNGQLLGMFKIPDPAFTLGGYGGVIRFINPDNSVAWEYTCSTENEICHHDVELLPNGNLLFMVWEKITVEEANSKGIVTTVPIYPEKLIEINKDSRQIVWQWRSWEHLIQDTDENLPSYGVVAENPNKINFNYNLPDDGDVTHANGIDYDPVKDVIFVSVNALSEVWVVDHSTSTLEAMQSTGGSYGKGGDLIYRFGNPEVYNNAQGERRFFNNHYPNFLQNDEIGAGNLLIYNNGTNLEQSTAYELAMPADYKLVANADNEPEVVWSFTDPDMFYGKLSGVTRLSNGNTMICEGDYGYWEVTTAGEVVWKYNGKQPTYWRGYSYDLEDEAVLNLGLSF